MRRPLQCETVAKNTRCQVLADLTGRREWRMDSRRDVLGCSRKEKNGATTSKRKTVTTNPKTRFPNIQQHWPKKPDRALAIGVRKKIHQEALDKKDSFREVAHDRRFSAVPENPAAPATRRHLPRPLPRA
jgi:hypothetical protein